MDLFFAYSGDLRGILEEKEPDTDRSIRIYSSSAEHYLHSPQPDDYCSLLERTLAFPEPEERQWLSPDFVWNRVVGTLGRERLWQKEVIRRTIQSHYRKLKPGRFGEELTIAVARCIPFFLLESMTEFPRTGLFRIKSDVVHHYLPLPGRKTYSANHGAYGQDSEQPARQSS